MTFFVLDNLWVLAASDCSNVLRVWSNRRVMLFFCLRWLVSAIHALCSSALRAFRRLHGTESLELAAFDSPCNSLSVRSFADEVPLKSTDCASPNNKRLTWEVTLMKLIGPVYSVENSWTRYQRNNCESHYLAHRNRLKRICNISNFHLLTCADSPQVRKTLDQMRRTGNNTDVTGTDEVR